MGTVSPAHGIRAPIGRSHVVNGSPLNWYPSPNFGDRRLDVLPDMVVIHYTAMSDATAALRALCAPEREVSAHYLIGKDGTQWQLVDETKRAWHAGAGQWGETLDVNSKSIGIELDNNGLQPFSQPLMEALEHLLAGILDRWTIPPERVIGHSDMAPTRKIDPGTRFDWRRLAAQGLSIWPDETNSSDATGPTAEIDEFRNLTKAFGYASDLDDSAVLQAFRLRFRPNVSSALDEIDVHQIANLARRYPVDRKLLTS